jgi:hypothetical protein
MRMIRTPRPSGIHERVVQRLLNVVYDMVLEVSGVVAEQQDARRRVYNHGLMTCSHGTGQVLY